MHVSVKNWFKSNYPYKEDAIDAIPDNITFGYLWDLIKKGHKIEDVLITSDKEVMDAVIRELAWTFNIPQDYIIKFIDNSNWVKERNDSNVTAKELYNFLYEQMNHYDSEIEEEHKFDFDTKIGIEVDGKIIPIKLSSLVVLD